MPPNWKVDERVVYETPWWRLYDDKITKEDGSRTTYVWARTTHGTGAVMCIPRTQDGRILMIRIYRHPMRRDAWEFVAGLIERGETAQETAFREVEEEVGVRPTAVKMFPPYVPISGFVGDQFHIAIATIPDVRLEDLRLQEDEAISEARFVTDAELREMVRSGQIEDGITLVALSHYWAAQEA